MINDSVSDMLTRIRNGVAIEMGAVDMPTSTLKVRIADALKREGFIWDFEILEAKPNNLLRVHLKYGPNGERLIQKIRRLSKPGRRVYTTSSEIPDVLQGLGICLLSTNKGVLSGREAKSQGVGGELLCEVW